MMRSKIGEILIILTHIWLNLQIIRVSMGWVICCRMELLEFSSMMHQRLYLNLRMESFIILNEINISKMLRMHIL